jgi:hypothetical protein
VNRAFFPCHCRLLASVPHLIMDRIGDEHPACIGEGFRPRRDVDAVAIEVIALDDCAAEIDADAPLDAVADRVAPGAIPAAAARLS